MAIVEIRIVDAESLRHAGCLRCHQEGEPEILLPRLAQVFSEVLPDGVLETASGNTLVWHVAARVLQVVPYTSIAGLTPAIDGESVEYRLFVRPDRSQGLLCCDARVIDRRENGRSFPRYRLPLASLVRLLEETQLSELEEEAATAGTGSGM